MDKAIGKKMSDKPTPEFFADAYFEANPKIAKAVAKDKKKCPLSESRIRGLTAYKNRAYLNENTKILRDALHKK